MYRCDCVFRPATICRKPAMRLRRSPSSSVVWVRSPVKTMKPGCTGRAFPACPACSRGFLGGSVMRSTKARGFEGALGPHLPAAVNLARWLIKNPQDAEDVVQEACLRAFACFDRFRGSSPRGWLLTIVRNACHSYFRRGRAPAPQQFDEEKHSAAEGSSPNGPEAKLLQSAAGQRSNHAVSPLA